MCNICIYDNVGKFLCRFKSVIIKIQNICNNGFSVTNDVFLLLNLTEIGENVLPINIHVRHNYKIQLNYYNEKVDENH